MTRPAKIAALVFSCACTASSALAHGEPDNPLNLRKPPQSGVENELTLHMRMELGSSKKKIVFIDPNVDFLVSNSIAVSAQFTGVFYRPLSVTSVELKGGDD